MYVSPEMITMILTGIGTVATMVGVMLTVQRHFQAQVDKRFDLVDKRFEQVDKRFDLVDTRFEQVGIRFDQIDLRFEHIERRFERADTQFESRFDRIQQRLDGVAEDVVEIKIAIARLEGPQPTLLRAR